MIFFDCYCCLRFTFYCPNQRTDCRSLELPISFKFLQTCSISFCWCHVKLCTFSISLICFFYVLFWSLLLFAFNSLFWLYCKRLESTISLQFKQMHITTHLCWYHSGLSHLLRILIFFLVDHSPSLRLLAIHFWLPLSGLVIWDSERAMSFPLHLSPFW